MSDCLMDRAGLLIDPCLNRAVFTNFTFKNTSVWFGRAKNSPCQVQYLYSATALSGGLNDHTQAVSPYFTLTLA